MYFVFVWKKILIAGMLPKGPQAQHIYYLNIGVVSLSLQKSLVHWEGVVTSGASLSGSQAAAYSNLIDQKRSFSSLWAFSFLNSPAIQPLGDVAAMSYCIQCQPSSKRNLYS